MQNQKSLVFAARRCRLAAFFKQKRPEIFSGDPVFRFTRIAQLFRDRRRFGVAPQRNQRLQQPVTGGVGIRPVGIAARTKSPRRK